MMMSNRMRYSSDPSSTEQSEDLLKSRDPRANRGLSIESLRRCNGAYIHGFAVNVLGVSLRVSPRQLARTW